MASDGKTSPFSPTGGAGSNMKLPEPKPSPNERMPGESPPGGPLPKPKPVDRGTGSITPFSEKSWPFSKR